MVQCILWCLLLRQQQRDVFGELVVTKQQMQTEQYLLQREEYVADDIAVTNRILDANHVVFRCVAHQLHYCT